MVERTGLGDIPSLDGWRAVAISIVFFSHAGWGNLIPGGLGVTVFFFLSGYLITTLMLKEFSKKATISLPHFYIRRGLRLFPPLIITLTITYLLTDFGWLDGHATLQGYIAQLLYFSNYYQLFFNFGAGIPSGTGVYWSLAVEEHFYFIFPVVFLFILCRRPQSKAPVILYSFCALEIIWRMYLIIGQHASWDRTYYASDTRMDSIAYGCALAFIMRAQTGKDWLEKDSVRRIMIAVGLLGLLASLAWRSEDFRNIWRYSIQGLSLTPLFYYSITRPDSGLFSLLNTRVMKKIGVYSYSIYLTHLIMISNLQLVTQNKVLIAAASAAICLPLAAIIDRFIDQPLQQVRHRFR